MSLTEKLCATEVALLNLVVELEGTSGAGISSLALFPSYGEAIRLLQQRGLMSVNDADARLSLIEFHTADEPRAS